MSRYWMKEEGRERSVGYRESKRQRQRERVFTLGKDAKKLPFTGILFLTPPSIELNNDLFENERQKCYG